MRSCDIAVDSGVAIQARRNSSRGIQVCGPSFVGNEHDESERLLKLHLRAAAEQLDAGKMPGFIVLANEASGLVDNHARALTQAIRNDSEGAFARVLGLVFYDTPIDSKLHRPVAHARIHLRSEASVLRQELAVLRQGGRVSLQLF
jgi:hypothetical protein